MSVIAGVLVGAVRTPSTHAVAAAVDRRLGLHDSTVTALECVSSLDPVSALVVKDANERTRDIMPAALFGLSFLPHARPLIGAAMVMSILALMRIGEPVQWNRGQGIRVPVSGAAAGQSPRDAERTSGAQATGAPGTPRSSNSGERSPTGREQVDPTVIGDQASASSTPEPASASSRAGAPGTAGRASAPTSVESAGTRQGDTTSGGSARSGNSGQSGAGAAKDGGRGGSTPGSGFARGAGGVRGQRAGDGVQSADALPAVSGSYATRYALAARQAEEAVKDGRVPPRLREHVRRYFNAIRPDQHP